MMNKVNKLFGEMYDLFKEVLLNDEEFIAEFKAKLEEKEEHQCEGNCGCDGNCGDDCKCKKEKESIETFDDYTAFCERFVMTNDKGEELIDANDLDVPVEDEKIEDYAKNVTPLIQEWVKEIQDDMPEEKEDVKTDVIEEVEENNALKKFGIAQATVEDLEDSNMNNIKEEIELSEEDIKDALEQVQELTEEELMEVIKQKQENGEIDLDIDLGALLGQLKLIAQQKNSYKFMERDVQEYDDIIEKSFGIFPTDLGGNDEIF